MKYLILILISNICLAQTRYVVPCSDHLRQASLDSAKKFVGIKEKTGHNDGKEVENILRHVGQRKGAPWCAGAVVTAIDTARGNEPLPILRTPLANGIYNDAKKRGRLSGYNIVLAGDIGTWRHPGTSQGHTCRVESVKWPFMITLEGNTGSGNGGSQRDGDGFYRRMRKIGKLGTMEFRGTIGLGK